MRRITLFSFLLFIVTFSVYITFGEQQKIVPEYHTSFIIHLEQKLFSDSVQLAPIENESVHAKAAIVKNMYTGDSLFVKNAATSLPIASMSKVMTELLVLEAIELGEIQWDDLVKISDYAYTISHQPGYSTVLLEKEKSYSIKQLFEAMAIRSANGATIALAEKIAGSEEKFVKRMNERAKELDLTNSTFVNSTGLTNVDLLGNHSVGGKNDANRMSAEDLANLATHLIMEYPYILDITKKREFLFGDETYTNSNWMLAGLDQSYVEADIQYATVDGLKTGFTKAAGYSFTGTAIIDNARVVSVVIGTEEIEDRFVETIKLYKALE